MDSSTIVRLIKNAFFNFMLDLSEDLCGIYFDRLSTSKSLCKSGLNLTYSVDDYF